MQVTLSIADDRELRAAIKDMIKGEVTSIARGEIKTIITDAVREGAIPKDTATLESLIRSEIAKLLRDEIFRAPSYGADTFVKGVARQEVLKLVHQLWEEGKIVPKE